MAFTPVYRRGELVTWLLTSVSIELSSVTAAADATADLGACLAGGETINLDSVPAAADATATAPTLTFGSTSAEPAAAAADATASVTVEVITQPIHWFYEKRTSGWFKDTFYSSKHNPISVYVFDGDSPSDRVVLLGGEDGYIRKVSVANWTDNGQPIIATVTLGPIADANGNVPIILRELQAHSDDDGPTLRWETLTGEDPQTALATADGFFSGDGPFAAGISAVHNPCVQGHYVYVKVGTALASLRWALENIRFRAAKLTSNRGRHG